MPAGISIGLVLLIGSALMAVVLGRNLTRSLAASLLAITGLVIAMLSAGAGFLALFVATVAALLLMTIQLFGWMLVDVDRDHLPETDRMTWIARSLAFLLLGGGLVLLILAIGDQGLLVGDAGDRLWAEPAAIGGLFFGDWRDLATLCGLALSSGLLAALMLLRDDGESR